MAGKSSLSTWERCPPGTFNGLSEKLQRRRTRRRFLQIAGRLAAAGAIGITGGTAFWIGASVLRGGPPGGLTCAQAREKAQAYIDGNLCPGERRQVYEHVRHCPRCQPIFRAKGVNIGCCH